MPAENSKVAAPAEPKPTCGLEHIDLGKAILAAPEDWQIAMSGQGALSWHSFAGVAYQRARALGINDSAWAQAQGALGAAPGAAILVLIADANAIERGGTIRSVGGWCRRMSERAETGTAHLHRSVHGLLHRREAV